MKLGVYIDGGLFLIVAIMLIYALRVFNDCKYDRISLVALLIFDACFLMDFIGDIFEENGYKNNKLFIIFRSYMIPLTLAIKMIILYIFIFQVERIRLHFQSNDYH